MTSPEPSSTEALVEEVAQAIINKDDTAVQVAVLACVGKWLELQERQAKALENIAEMLERSQHRADYGFFVRHA